MKYGRALASVATLFLSVGIVAMGCATGDSVSETEGSGSDASTSTAGTGGAGATSSSDATTSTTSSGMGGGSGTGGEGGQGGSDPCAAGCPTGTWDVDGNPLTGDCGCEYLCVQTSATEDPIDEDFTDDNCDGGDGLVEQCVYVSTSQGDDANAGTRQTPMKTIAAAIQQAVTAGVPAVCLSGEIYQEAVTVVSGVSIYGGFDQDDVDFKFRRKQGIKTTVQAPGTVFDAPTIDTDTHIQGITIDAQQSLNSGASNYGVRLGGGVGTLYVEDNTITVAAGKDGADGADGAAASPAQAPGGNGGENGAQDDPNAGDGGLAPVCAEPGGKGGKGGYDTGGGGPGSAGSGNAAGGSAGSAPDYCPDTGGNGGPGTKGQDGTSGSTGIGGAALGTIANGLYTPANGTSGGGGTNGKGAGGGGGGGGGQLTYEDPVFGTHTDICNPDSGGGGGSGGCGGLGGAGGVRGVGGGASFGVFAAGGTLAVNNNSIQTGPGGKGGKGGNGAGGQQGGTYGSGGAAGEDSGSGGNGGVGGSGGAGGPGGGGGGGPSACIASATQASVTVSHKTCLPGAAGLGGAGGTNPVGAVASPGAMGTAALELSIN